MAPKHKEKFERMAASLFPQQAQTCAAFIRHKDILISPSQLRTYDIPYMQVRPSCRVTSGGAGGATCTGVFKFMQSGTTQPGTHRGVQCKPSSSRHAAS